MSIFDGGASKIDIPSGPTRETRARRSSHARYNLFVYGCTSDVYKVILPSENDTYAGFLQSRDFFAEHPREDSDSLALVQRLKPFWSTDCDCYHWLENARLRPQNGENDESDSMDDDDM